MLCFTSQPKLKKSSNSNSAFQASHMNLISKLFPQKEKCCSTPEKSRILIIGGAGLVGKFVVEASKKSGHPTFAFIDRGLISDPTTGELIQGFKNSGVTILIGDVDDKKGLVKAIKQVDVVVSTMGYLQISDQVKILAAIKKAGNVKRFFPSEFGSDVDRGNKLLRAIKSARVPYTYITLNYFAGSSLPRLGQPGAETPPRDKVVIFGDGNAKAVFNNERDVGTYIVKAVDDPRTLSKILYIRPPKNIYSLNELVALWEKKIGKTLEKEYIPEEQLLKQIQESRPPLDVVLSIHKSIFVKGDDENKFQTRQSSGVEASELYPDVEYSTVEEYLDQFV